MIDIVFKPSFIRQFKQIEAGLQDEVEEKILLLKERKNHLFLKVHKLHGRLSGCWSFSVNYKTRVIFLYESKNQIVLLAIGNHELYDY